MSKNYEKDYTIGTIDMANLQNGSSYLRATADVHRDAFGRPTYLGVDMEERGLLKPAADWTYTMKREAQEIVPGLYLGPYGAAKNLEFLQKNGITDILIVRSADEAQLIKPKFPGQFEYHNCTCNHSQFENIIQYFADVKRTNREPTSVR